MWIYLPHLCRAGKPDSFLAGHGRAAGIHVHPNRHPWGREQDACVPGWKKRNPFSIMEAGLEPRGDGRGGLQRFQYRCPKPARPLYGITTR